MHGMKPGHGFFKPEKIVWSQPNTNIHVLRHHWTTMEDETQATYDDEFHSVIVQAFQQSLVAVRKRVHGGKVLW
jgi:hypothetical protein